MSKYDSLWRHLQESGQPQQLLTFDEIGQIAGVPVDHSFLRYKKELLRLGILTMALPVGCAVAGRIVEGIVAGFLAVETAALDLSLGNEASLALGLMFVLGSLLCRHGAELTAGGGADA